MFQSPTTLKKISALSGFSVSTVSKALNNKGDVSHHTKKIIQRIAKNNNYVPNYSALALRKQETKIIAVIIPHITDKFYGHLLSEIQKHTFELGYRLLLLQTFTSEKTEKECYQFINDGSVDGVIMFSSSENHYLMDKFEKCNMVPSIFIQMETPRFDEFEIKCLAEEYFNLLLSKLMD